MLKVFLQSYVSHINTATYAHRAHKHTASTMIKRPIWNHFVSWRQTWPKWPQSVNLGLFRQPAANMVEIQLESSRQLAANIEKIARNITKMRFKRQFGAIWVAGRKQGQNEFQEASLEPFRQLAANMPKEYQKISLEPFRRLAATISIAWS